MKCQKMTIKEAESRCQNYIVQMKLDGTRTIWEKGNLISPERDIFKSDRYRHIANELKGFNGVLDGEIFLPNGNLFAVSSSENWNKCRYAVFDILEYDGQNLRGIPYQDRRKLLIALIQARNWKSIEFVKEFPSVSEGWDFVKSQDLEGLVLKSPEGSYTDTRSWNWVKVKNYHEAVIEILEHIAGSDKGRFVLANGGKMSALSPDFVEQYKKLKAKGKVFAEIEYLYLTKEKKYFQPILKRLRGGLNE